ncbi:unnamed protein product [Miscanthus lutarioriparius]|uniref:AB hydrolase-1 domain-containing protein n=1 Tax=Miscanthus lutarioriparius TaxID=422564 RepID=A0A811NTL0_9POAL|nr:unnamed protein product [Miscanthus lutarioriparius]
MESGTKQRRRQHHFVLVHCAYHGAWCWYKVATLLSSAGHRVTALDMAACGASPGRAEEVPSFEEYSRPLLAAVAGLPPDEKAVLISHSFGGLNLALAMERYPDRVADGVRLRAGNRTEIHDRGLFDCFVEKAKKVSNFALSMMS